LLLTRITRGNLLEEADWARFAIHDELKLIAIKTADKTTVFVDHCDGRLDEFSLYAHHLVVGFLTLLLPERINP